MQQFASSPFELLHHYSFKMAVKQGLWSYYVQGDIDSPSAIRLDVWYKPAIDQAVTIDTWTSSLSRERAVDLKTERVSIHAMVTFGERAVGGLTNTILVHLVGDYGTESVSGFLMDNNNPADVTQGDGIYSAFVTRWPSGSTCFAYVIEIVDNDRGTYETGEDSYLRMDIR